jgi:hypothetical protein
LTERRPYPSIADLDQLQCPIATHAAETELLPFYSTADSATALLFVHRLIE